MNDTNGTVYIVSGLPRSGTSMIMRMLEAGGMTILTDNIRTADDDNLQGYYEFERVKKLKEGDTAWVEQARGKVVKVISALLEHLPNNYHYKIIFMERDMMEILASQGKMLDRRGKPGKPEEDKTFAAIYEKHLIKVKDWLARQSNLAVIYINYNDLLKKPQVYTEEIQSFLDIPLDLQAMRRVPDERFYRQRNPPA